jgi:hypothetical protein
MLFLKFINQSGQINFSLDGRQCHTDYVCCSGYGSGSNLSILENGIRINVLNNFTFSDPIMYALTCNPPSDFRKVEHGLQSAMEVT